MLQRLALAVAVVCAATPLHAADEKRLNVLLIVADDLRVELGCYGSVAKSPNIDRLAQRGIRFNRAYCQQALCNPSRSSFLSGLRPDTLGLWTNNIHFRELRPDVVTLPQWFKQHGYVTRDVGKIFHNWHTVEKGDRRSWSAPEFLHYANHGDDKPMVDVDAPPENLAVAPRCERCDVPDEAYYDGRVANEAVRVLAEIKDQPFFLAVGFWKPHSPFNAPDAYWRRYTPEQIPLVDLTRPAGAPEVAFHDGREIRGAPPRQIDFTPQQVAEIRLGYHANVTYMDAQVGKVLAALDEHGLTDSTVVVFLSDHGYHLGEHGLWAKTSCFELDARVPLIIAPPGAKNAGAATNALAELLDVYPTLTELCGLPKPPMTEGVSLRPVLDDPSATVKSVACTQHPRPAYYDREPSKTPEAMGYSVRTDRCRYTEWRSWQTGEVVARELYDHVEDPAETRNVIDAPPDSAALEMAVAAMQKAFPKRVPANAGQ